MISRIFPVPMFHESLKKKKNLTKRLQCQILNSQVSTFFLEFNITSLCLVKCLTELHSFCFCFLFLLKPVSCFPWSKRMARLLWGHFCSTNLWQFFTKQLILDLSLVFCAFSSTLAIEKPSTLHCCVSLWILTTPFTTVGTHRKTGGKDCCAFDLSFPISPFCALLSENINIMLKQGHMG